MLNAQPIGGKKGTRWRDDVWTMKYLPKFKWHMLTEQVGQCFVFICIMCLLIPRHIAHEAAVHTAKLRVELSQSKTEQRDYLKNVELARVLDKRAQRKKERGDAEEEIPKKRRAEPEEGSRKIRRVDTPEDDSLKNVLGSIF